MKKITIHDIDYPKIKQLIFDDKGNFIDDEITVDFSNIYPTITFLRDEDYVIFQKMLKEMNIRER